jgi:hypothetical protein
VDKYLVKFWNERLSISGHKANRDWERNDARECRPGTPSVQMILNKNLRSKLDSGQGGEHREQEENKSRNMID